MRASHLYSLDLSSQRKRKMPPVIKCLCLRMLSMTMDRARKEMVKKNILTHRIRKLKFLAHIGRTAWWTRPLQIISRVRNVGCRGRWPDWWDCVNGCCNGGQQVWKKRGSAAKEYRKPWRICYPRPEWMHNIEEECLLSASVCIN